MGNACHAHDLAQDIDCLRFEEAGLGDIDDGEVPRIEEEAANLIVGASIPVIAHHLTPVIDPGDLRQVRPWGIEECEGAACEEETTGQVVRIGVSPDDPTEGVDPRGRGRDHPWDIEGREGAVVEEEAMFLGLETGGTTGCQVPTDDLAEGIDRCGGREDGTRGIDGREGPMREEIAMVLEAGILIVADDLAAGVDCESRGVGRTRDIEEGDSIRGLMDGGERPEHQA